MRIGVNWALDQELLTGLMDENTASENPKGAAEVTRGYCEIGSFVCSAGRRLGMPRSRIIISAKVSAVQDLIAVYRDLASRCDHALHLGLTEAGMGTKGVVASAAGMGILLQEGIGDTIRVSLTPEPTGDRTREVAVAQELLQTMGDKIIHSLGSILPWLWSHDLNGISGACTKHQVHIRERVIEWRKIIPGWRS